MNSAVKTTTGRSIVFYSVLYGDTEPVNPTLFENGKGSDNIVFTDQPDLVVSGARSIMHPVPGLQPKFAARRVKLVPEYGVPDCDWIVFQDNRTQLTIAPDALIERVEEAYGKDAAPGRFFFSHPFRNCAYEEALANVIQGTMSLADCDGAISALMRAGVPRQDGVTHDALMIQKMGSESARAFNVRWYELTLAYGRRDQVALPLAAAAMETKIRVLPFEMSDVSNWPVFNRRAREKYQGAKPFKPSQWLRFQVRKRRASFERNVPLAT